MVVIDEYEEIIENIETLIDDASDEVLASIRDDTKFPVVEDGKIQMLLKMILEFIKCFIHYLINNIKDASEKEKQ